MMKRVLMPFVFALLANPASASPELAKLWAAKAAGLSAQSETLLNAARRGEAPDLDEDYLIELERFVLNAGRLGAWSDSAGSPAAMGCSFRRLGEEAETQLDALEGARTARASEMALARLIVLLHDARDLSTAATSAARAGSAQPASVIRQPGCPDDPPGLSRIAAR
ncbi:MAG TPA: hypothetical protein PK417_07645 [Hyphomonas sp.]|nr:hypothetical protein [Hyphomonas sp.]